MKKQMEGLKEHIALMREKYKEDVAREHAVNKDLIQKLGDQIEYQEQLYCRIEDTEYQLYLEKRKTKKGTMILPKWLMALLYCFDRVCKF